jgi:hypothetical protein
VRHSLSLPTKPGNDGGAGAHSQAPGGSASGDRWQGSSCPGDGEGGWSGVWRGDAAPPLHVAGGRAVSPRRAAPRRPAARASLAVG